MKTFKIKASSWVAFILTLMAIVFSSVFVMPRYDRNGNFVIVAMVSISIVVFAYIIGIYVSMATVECTIDETGIQIRWVKQFLFKKMPDRVISWDEIIKYKYRSDKNFDLFKLVLTDGSVIRLWHSTFTFRDDFDKFLICFEEKVRERNRKNKKPSKGPTATPTHTIQKDESLW